MCQTLLFTRFQLQWHPGSTRRDQWHWQYWPPLVPPCQLHLNLESNFHPIWHHVSNAWSLMMPETATTSLQCQQTIPSKLAYKVPRITRAKAKETPMSSVSLNINIAVEVRSWRQRAKPLRIDDAILTLSMTLTKSNQTPLWVTRPLLLVVICFLRGPRQRMHRVFNQSLIYNRPWGAGGTGWSL